MTAVHRDAPPHVAQALAVRLRAERESLVRRWLDRIAARVALSPTRVFPTEDLLNHVPLLIDGVADYLERPADGIDATVPVLAKARELGALRHRQGFDAHEILKEHELLGAILFHFMGEEVVRQDGRDGREVAECWQRLAQAVELVRQATMSHFLQLAAERVHERESRLRRFNRMVSHELKNRVGVLRGASALLQESWLDGPQREKFARMVEENAVGLTRVLENLEQLSRTEADARQRKNVLLPQAAREAARQLRDAAAVRGVRVSIADDLPNVEVDAATVELCLVNYMSNGIKYCDPSRAERTVHVEGALAFGPRPEDGELRVLVRDNGLGVPVDARERLFTQFYRVHEHTITGVEGTGLGLSIVRETVEAVGGRVWADFPPEGGAVFGFSLPSRREEDAAAAGLPRGEPVERA
jgi:signal transduction histidine kinase